VTPHGAHQESVRKDMSKFLLATLYRRARIALRRETLHASLRARTRDQERERAYDAMVLDVLREAGALPLSVLVDRVSQQALRAEDGVEREMDAGIWGAAVYRDEAARAIKRLLGRQLALESDGPWLLAVPMLPDGTRSDARPVARPRSVSGPPIPHSAVPAA
jgi:hypothetical protein